MTLLFTDIEGSTRLLQESGDRYAAMLVEHRRAIRTAVAAHRGVEVDTQGDAFLIAFSRASDAAAAAIDAQRSLSGGPIRVRMGMHTGEPALGDKGYIGIDVHRGARICAAGHGGQVLLSDATRRSLDGKAELRDLGEHRLKDLKAPEWLFQLNATGLESDFPPLRSLNNSNLPSWPSSFVGRERELSELSKLLSRDGTRLITLTGPGGTGKTRLAIGAAATVVGRFKNGVFLVELASISDPERVLTTVAQTLGATSASNEMPLDTLRRHLDGKTTLLVLDNFEQLLPAAADVHRLLEAAPGLRIVVTSREKLRVRGEQEYAVKPLEDAEAYELFVERAIAVLPDFGAVIDRQSVRAICSRLDGLPLAIELAAARVKILTASEMLTRLEHRLSTLTHGARDVPQRQQTLRSTIDWSFDLLDPIERDAFAATSVFVGGCTPAAAEAVGGVGLDVLASLLDKSLLQRKVSTVGPRFSMLETIREYAGEHLDLSGRTGELRARHARYFADLAEQSQTGDPRQGALHERATGKTSISAFYGGPDEASLLDLFASERENLATAITWYAEGRDSAAAIRLFLDVARLWLLRGPLHDGWTLAQKLLQLDDAPNAADFGLLLMMASEFPRWLGDNPPAREMIERAIVLFRARGEEKELAYALTSFANIVALQGDFVLARTCADDSLALARGLDDPISTLHALNTLACLAFWQADYGRMRDIGYEEVALCRQTGSQNGLVASLHNLAEARRRLGELDAAVGHYQEALKSAEKLGSIGDIAELLDGLADVAATRGDLVHAVRLWGGAHRLFVEDGAVQWDPDEQRRGVEAARAALGQAAFDAAWGSGVSMATPDIVRNGLSIQPLSA